MNTTNNINPCMNNLTANIHTNRTDAECDEIIANDNVVLRKVEVQVVDFTMYRSSQYTNFDEAYRNGGIVCKSDLHGYDEAVNFFHTVGAVANFMDHRSSDDDLRVRISVNRKQLPECFLGQATRQVHHYLVREGLYGL